MNNINMNNMNNNNNNNAFDQTLLFFLFSSLNQTGVNMSSPTTMSRLFPTEDSCNNEKLEENLEMIQNSTEKFLEKLSVFKQNVNRKSGLNLHEKLIIQLAKDTAFSKQNTIFAGEIFYVFVKTDVQNLKFDFQLKSCSSNSSANSSPKRSSSQQQGNGTNSIVVLQKLISKYKDDSYILALTIQKSGRFIVGVRLFGNELANSPCEISIKPGNFDVSNSIIKIPQMIFVNQLFDLHVLPRDAFKNEIRYDCQNNSTIDNENNGVISVVTSDDDVFFVDKVINGKWLIIRCVLRSCGEQNLYFNGKENQKIYFHVEDNPQKVRITNRGGSLGHLKKLRHSRSISGRVVPHRIKMLRNFKKRSKSWKE